MTSLSTDILFVMSVIITLILIMLSIICLCKNIHNAVYVFTLMILLRNAVIIRIASIDIRLVHILFYIIIVLTIIHRIFFSKNKFIIRFNKIDLMILILSLSLFISFLLSGQMSTLAKDFIQYMYLIMIYFYIRYTLKTKDRIYEFSKYIMISNIIIIIFYILSTIIFKQSIIPQMIINVNQDISVLFKYDYSFIHEVLDSHRIYRYSSFYLGKVGTAFLILINIFFIEYKIKNDLYKHKNRLWYYIVIFLSLLIMLQTYSRVAFVSLISAALFCEFIQKRYKKFMIYAVIMLAVSITLFAVSTDFRYRALEIFDNDGVSSKESHKAQFIMAIYMGVDSPVLGKGPGGYQANLEEYKKYAFEYTDLEMKKEKMLPHNFILTFWAESGAIGTLFIIIIFMQVFIYLYNKIKKTEKEEEKILGEGVLKALLVAILMSFTMNGVYWEIFWIVLALSVNVIYDV